MELLTLGTYEYRFVVDKVTGEKTKERNPYYRDWTIDGDGEFPVGTRDRDRIIAHNANIKKQLDKLERPFYAIGHVRDKSDEIVYLLRVKKYHLDDKTYKFTFDYEFIKPINGIRSKDINTTMLIDYINISNIKDGMLFSGKLVCKIPRPSLFIGSSIENLSTAYAIQSNLEHDSEPTVWTQGVFQLSSSTIRDLLNQVNNVDFAIFVFSPDDVTTIRKREMQTVRDNVVFEMGMFIGGLGIERTFFVIPHDTKELHLPTDLIGVEPGRYNSKREDGNLRAALGPVCHEISQKMKVLGKK